MYVVVYPRYSHLRSVSPGAENSVGSTTSRPNRAYPRSALLKPSYVRNERGRENRKRLNATSSTDPGTLVEFSKFNAVGGKGESGQAGEREVCSFSLSLSLYVRGNGWRLVSLGIKPGDRSHRRFSEPVGISEPPRRGFRTCFPVHRKRGGRSYAARRRAGGERGVVRTGRRRSVARRRRMAE